MTWPLEAQPRSPMPACELHGAMVAGSRTPAVPAGATVAMTYGHRTGYVANPTADRVVPMPPDLHPLLGIYVARMGPICINGLLHAAADACGIDVRSVGDGVRGRRVVVIGAGAVALLTALLARRHQAESVVVIDPAAGRGRGHGTGDNESGGPGRRRRRPEDPLAARPRRPGADVVFQCRGQASALHLALRVARPQAIVVDLAFYQGGVPELRLGAEFHHNGLAIRCAQIGRVPRGLAHAWDRERLSAEPIALLRSDGAAILEQLVTAFVPFEDGPQLLTGMAAGQRHELQAVLTFEWAAC